MSGVPIFTLLLNEVKTNAAIVIGSTARVFVNPSRGLREELANDAQKMYSNIFTDKVGSKKVNLSTEKEFDLEVHTWVKADTDDSAREKAVLLDAQIQEQILPLSSSVRRYAQYFEEQSAGCSDILYYSEGLCVVISRYHVKFRHAYGKPTQQNP
jgi:hypothetical protein